MWETERVKLQWILLNFNYPAAAVNRRERRMNRIPRRNGFFSTPTLWFPESAMLKLSPRLQKEATLSEEILMLKGTWLSITGVEWFSSLSSPQNVLCLSHRQGGREQSPSPAHSANHSRLQSVSGNFPSKISSLAHFLVSCDLAVTQTKGHRLFSL